MCNVYSIGFYAAIGWAPNGLMAVVRLSVSQLIVLVHCILSLFCCVIFVFFPGPMRCICYFYGMIIAFCAESAVKHQLTN